MRCEHEHEDGAYVLGALSPAERTAYERHLATCSFCREAVADIAALPDVLARLDAREFATLVDVGHPSPRPVVDPVHPARPTGRRPSTREAVRRAGRNRRVRLLSTAAAVLLVVLVGAGVVAWTRDGAPAAPPPGPAVAMTAVDGTAPITATVRLTGGTGGTRVETLCSYSRAAARPYTFRLLAYGPDEQQEQIGSWQASPGAEFTMQSVTHFARDSLARLELVRFDGRVLLAYDVPAAAAGSAGR